MPRSHVDTGTIQGLLRQLFGFQEFRPGQLETIETILNSDQDVVCVQPTSAGKTLPFQLITAALRQQMPSSITLVVEPLVALMVDQVQIWNDMFTLRPDGSFERRSTTTTTEDKRNVAVMLSSMQNDDDCNAERNANNGMYPVVYVAPEKLPFLSKRLLEHVQLLVVDECHCLTEHGQSFRPAYRNIRTFLPGVQTLALTATACTTVEHDVMDSLRLCRPLIIRGDASRYNLRLLVRTKHPSMTQNIELLKEYTASGRSVVFCPTRAECESITRALTTAGATWCRPYHAGMTPGQRQQMYQEFLRSNHARILVATCCFGLGVNIPDIETVIHFGLPRSTLAYVQECGRAGRDGRLATCLMLYRPTDISKYARTERDVELAKHMLQMARDTSTCRHQAIRRAFGGGAQDLPTDRRCTWHTGQQDRRSQAGCDVCEGKLGHHRCSENMDGDFPVNDANLLLRAIRETGNYSGVSLPVDFLLGVKSARVRRHKKSQSKYSVYGLGRHRDRTQWMQMHAQLVEKGKLREIITHRGFIVYKVHVGAKTQPGRPFTDG